MLALLALLLAPPVPTPSPTPRPQPPALVGRVLGPGERPLEGALVLAGRPGEAPRQARTDARGAFRIELLDARPVAVRAEAPGLAATELARARAGKQNAKNAKRSPPKQSKRNQRNNPKTKQTKQQKTQSTKNQHRKAKRNKATKNNFTRLAFSAGR